MKYLWEKLKEASTWRGLVWIITAGGVALTEIQVEAIISAGIALTGLVEVFRGEKKWN